jgi:hypothetical protein
MSRRMLLCLSFLLPGCITVHRSPRPIHAPPAEEAKVVRPFPIPREGGMRLEGNTVAAIQLAMDHFLPRGMQPSSEELEWKDECQFRRESYDVTAVPGPEGVMLVRFILNEEVCPLTKGSVDAVTGKPPVDMFTYAVDIRSWRILSIGTTLKPRVKAQSPK